MELDIMKTKGIKDDVKENIDNNQELEKELERLREELQKEKKTNDSLREAMVPPEADFIRVSKAVVSLSNEDKAVFLNDPDFRKRCVELFRLAPRKYKFKKQLIQQKKMELFEVFKELLIDDYARKTGELRTRWSVAGINVMGAHHSYITDRDKILLIARHPAALQCKAIPSKLATEKGIEFRVKLAIRAEDIAELVDEVHVVDGGRVI
jgi:hypothetical protein